MRDQRHSATWPDPPGGDPPDGSVRVRPPGCQATVQLSSGQGLKQQLSATLKEALRPVIVVMSGGDVGKRIPVCGNAVLGRDPTADIVLGDSGVSWRHARLEDRGDAWAVVDLGSTNGTVVRNEHCRDAVLAPGDSILLGQTLLRFELRDSIERAYDAELQRLIDIDDLSGLYVRRKFDRELATLVEAARTRGVPLGLLGMDMDGIKQINDAHGHLFGAYVIGETGHLIGRVLVGRGIGCRFGGDEFFAALPDLDARAAWDVAVRIHAEVNAHPYARDSIPLRPGISIGVASFPADAGDAVSLFERADKALYRAKQTGRNRVSL
ncbi:MAG: diguanylate cyclase [Deltaproteobacteria bacterium]|nr:diguanylate cyclase [Deltaproteobacteria bacterium]